MSEEVRTITVIIDDLVNGGLDAADDIEELTDKAIAESGLPTELVPVYRAIVRWRAWSQLRKRARASSPVWSEQPANEPTTPRLTPPVAPTSLARPEWMRQRFSLSDGTMPTWADATVAEHELRIADQLKLAGGIKRDIDNHTEAIRRIKACPGATCLADLPEYGGAPPEAAA